MRAQLMLYSEMKGWHSIITWDNPVPADSSAMVTALSALGKLTKVQTKTTYILAPRKNISWQRIRKALTGNLHPRRGNAVYVNLKSGGVFEWGRNTRFLWKKVN
jgi:hypothetical protein